MAHRQRQLRKIFATLTVGLALTACAGAPESAEPSPSVSSPASPTTPANTPSPSTAAPQTPASTPEPTVEQQTTAPTTQPNTVPPPEPKPAQPRGSVDCSVSKCVALTYDDGPSNLTPKLLDTLSAKDATATFFLIGQNVVNLPQVVKRTHDLGFEIGNHSWTHPELTKVSVEQLNSELSRTSAAITQITGEPVTLMRPPYGAFNQTVLNAAAQQGLTVVHWTNSPEDWRADRRTPEQIADITLQRVTPGSIILMHDIHTWTVDAAPMIIDGLRAQGYEFVTVSELAGPVQPGELLPR